MTKIVEYNDGRRQRLVLSYMIFHKGTLARIASAWKEGGMFDEEVCDAVGQMCVDYLERCGRAPKANIRPLIVDWLDHHQHQHEKFERMQAIVAPVLDGMNEFKANLDPKYGVVLAQKLFDRAAKQRFLREFGAAMEAGRPERADELYTAYRKVELSEDQGAFLEEESLWTSAEEELEEVIKLDGPIGLFFDRCLEREGLVAFLAAEKRGKTRWLTWVAWQAMNQRRRVAWFGCGDMNRGQYMRRLGPLVSQRPFWPEPWETPTAAEVREVEVVEGARRKRFVVSAEDEHQAPSERLALGDAWRKYLKCLDRLKSHGRLFWTSFHANNTLTIQKLESILDRRESQDNWRPDVLVVDYADIMAMPKARESRDQHNLLWKELRRLSQERRCLLLTATQASKESQRCELVSMAHASEDKRKVAEATAMIGVNVDSWEKKQQVCRLNWAAGRETKYSSDEVLYCAGCWSIGNPAMITRFPSREKQSREFSKNGRIHA